MVSPDYPGPGQGAVAATTTAVAREFEGINQQIKVTIQQTLELIKSQIVQIDKLFNPSFLSLIAYIPFQSHIW